MKTDRCPRIFKPYFLILITICLLISSLQAMADSANKTRPQDMLRELDRKHMQVYKAYSRVFCQRFFVYDKDKFLILPNYRENTLNSSAKTIDGVTEELTKIITIRGGGGVVIKEKEELPPRDEVMAVARALPDMDVGHYGYLIQVKVKEVLGPMEMIVTEPVFVEREGGLGTERKNKRALHSKQEKYEEGTYRLIGFSTKELLEDSIYSGPDDRGLQIAVASTEPDTENHSVLVNVDRIRVCRTYEFVVMLDHIDMTPKTFIELVRENRKEYGNEKGDVVTLMDIYPRFYKRYRAEEADGQQQEKWKYNASDHESVNVPKFPDIPL